MLATKKLRLETFYDANTFLNLTSSFYQYQFWALKILNLAHIALFPFTLDLPEPSLSIQKLNVKIFTKNSPENTCAEVKAFLVSYRSSICPENIKKPLAF